MLYGIRSSMVREDRDEVKRLKQRIKRLQAKNQKLSSKYSDLQLAVLKHIGYCAVPGSADLEMALKELGER